MKFSRRPRLSANNQQITVLVTTNFGRAQELLYDAQTGMLQRAQVKLFLVEETNFPSTSSLQKVIRFPATPATKSWQDWNF